MPGDGRVVVLLNKDLEDDADVILDFGKGRSRSLIVEALQAPTIDSRDAKIAEQAHGKLGDDGRFRISVPHASGVRVIVS
jgi:hypothetical protein